MENLLQGYTMQHHDRGQHLCVHQTIFFPKGAVGCGWERGGDQRFQINELRAVCIFWINCLVLMGGLVAVVCVTGTGYIPGS